MNPEIRTRPVTGDDLEIVLAILRAGFASYVDFAPAGWVPVEPHRAHTLTVLQRPDTWAQLAIVDGRPAGHVAFTPARGDPFDDPDGWRDAEPVPGKAHLWQLFVLPEYWGAGIAGPLHDAAVDAMGERGYERARLFTPVAHTRARRFYERRGWRAGSTMDDSDLGLPLVEYEIELSPRR